MRVIADLHIHSKYSRATSADMDIEPLTRFGKLKGLNLIGTGDSTHPKWLSTLKEKLVEVEGTGLYAPRFEKYSPARFMITTEVSTIFEYGRNVKKIHHVILMPSIEVAEQVNDRLEKWGDLSVDGRPTLMIDAPTLVEEVMSISKDIEIFPAHAYTPWFSIFGAFSGFDRVEECYQDATKHIHAIESGLSSDPKMSWRLSHLDRFTIVSNSDSHSAWPWRLGREANVFELEKFTYEEIVRAIREKDPNRFKFTIETDPAYGKYHYTGHRNCNVSLSPTEAIRLGNKCPKCGRRLTKGVEQRVEELADRSPGHMPRDAIPFIHLLPLSEIIATVKGIDQVASRSVWEIYHRIVGKFGSEYSTLLDAKKEELLEVTSEDIAEMIIRVREDRVKVIPGFDGVYGRLVVEEVEEEEARPRIGQRGLEEFL